MDSDKHRKFVELVTTLEQGSPSERALAWLMTEVVDQRESVEELIAKVEYLRKNTREIPGDADDL